jgi:hypothetical protein
VSDKPFSSPKTRPARAGSPHFLFEFVRAADNTRLTCQVRNQGKSFGWEAQFLERGELFYSRGLFTTRSAALRWAEEERKAMEK